MSDRVRLTYFAGYGLAEQTRWMLAAAGIDWEQVALSRHEQFLEMRSKGELLFGQLPLLEIDGLNIVQSQAMFRYVAQRSGLWGKSLQEAALIDMIAEGIKDCRGPVVSFPFTPDQGQLAAEIPARTSKQLGPLEAQIRNTADGKLGFVASGLSAADVLTAELAEELLNIRGDALNPYPKIAALHRQVVSIPSVQAYLRSPKRYPFPVGPEREKYVRNVQEVLGR
eukprot:TRINITY_DN94692_c0_g1_i1.p1 TRINITY_DN94692_c0_g1~~TRINITY_DN94692_c0_g1_i1.p1  ORF type:complete len:236 (-),score=25.74 TRINITY_DN94692_c0_g1_i1:122-796(-)